MAEKHLSNLQLNILKNAKEDIETQIEKMQKEITDLQTKVIGNARKIDKLNIQVKTLSYQLRDLEDQITDVEARTDDNYLLVDNEKLEKAEEKYEDKLAKLEDLEDIRKELIAARDTKKSFIGRKIYQKKIERAEKKIDKLKNKVNKIEGKQRSLIMNKQFLNEVKNKKINQRLAETNYYKNVQEDLKETRDDILNNGEYFTGIRAKYYDMKANRYKKKHDKSLEKFKKMVSGKVSLKSARVMVWTKGKINKNRNISFENGTPRLAI